MHPCSIVYFIFGPFPKRCFQSGFGVIMYFLFSLQPVTKNHNPQHNHYILQNQLPHWPTYIDILLMLHLGIPRSTLGQRAHIHASGLIRALFFLLYFFFFLIDNHQKPFTFSKDQLSSTYKKCHIIIIVQIRYHHNPILSIFFHVRPKRRDIKNKTNHLTQWTNWQVLNTTVYQIVYVGIIFDSTLRFGKNIYAWCTSCGTM